MNAFLVLLLLAPFSAIASSSSSDHSTRSEINRLRSLSSQMQLRLPRSQSLETVEDEISLRQAAPERTRPLVQEDHDLESLELEDFETPRRVQRTRDQSDSPRQRRFRGL